MRAHIKAVWQEALVAGDATDGSLESVRQILPHPSRRDELGCLTPRETFTSTR